MTTINKALTSCILAMLAGAGTAAAEGTQSQSNDASCPTANCPSTTETTTEPTLTPQANEPVCCAQQTPPATQPPPSQPQPTYTNEAEGETWTDTLERYGIALSLGGGVDDFAKSSYRDITKVGGGWDVRLTIGTRMPIAFEGSYIGSAQTVDLIGTPDNGTLVGNGAQGALRINILDWNVQPFVFGGVAWRHYSISNSNFVTASDINKTDNVLEVPAGLGFDYKYRGFLFDARGDYRFAWYGDMFDRVLGNSNHPDRWGVEGNIGYVF